MKRCACGRKAMTFAPGSAATYAPGHILLDRGARAQAWCKRCAEAHGWLVEPERATIAAACATPRSHRKSALAKRSRRK